jgi:hypothetical protein
MTATTYTLLSWVREGLSTAVAGPAAGGRAALDVGLSLAAVS